MRVIVVSRQLIKRWINIYHGIPVCYICKQPFMEGDVIFVQYRKGYVRRYHRRCYFGPMAGSDEGAEA